MLLIILTNILTIMSIMPKTILTINICQLTGFGDIDLDFDLDPGSKILTFWKMIKNTYFEPPWQVKHSSVLTARSTPVASCSCSKVLRRKQNAESIFDYMIAPFIYSRAIYVQVCSICIPNCVLYPSKNVVIHVFILYFVIV